HHVHVGKLDLQLPLLLLPGAGEGGLVLVVLLVVGPGRLTSQGQDTAGHRDAVREDFRSDHVQQLLGWEVMAAGHTRAAEPAVNSRAAGTEAEIILASARLYIKRLSQRMCKKPPGCWQSEGLTRGPWRVRRWRTGTRLGSAIDWVAWVARRRFPMMKC